MIKYTGKKIPIITEPDPRLHQQSHDVKEVNDEIRELAEDMFFSMKEGNGIGLAAVQVGVLLNLLIVDAKAICDSNAEAAENRPSEDVLCIINPEVLEQSSETDVCEEGCLSYPGLDVPVTRAKWIKIKFQDYNNHTREMKASGLLARCILHEMDHARGKVIADYLSPMKRQMALKKFQKRSKAVV